MNVQQPILLIEDDDFIAKAYKIGLEKEGFVIDVVANGADGLRAVRENAHGLVLLDLILPTMDGFELLEQLQKDGIKTLPPIIILSNLGQDTDIERGKMLGAVDYLVKANTSMEHVARKIREYLRG